MIKSMTGFGRYETVTDHYKLSVEIKAVNHRYLDLGIKLPKAFGCFEAAVRNLLKQQVQRGKIDVFINYEDYTEEQLCLHYNSALASEYMECFRQMEEQFSITNDITVSMLSRCPEVLVMEQVSQDEEQMLERLTETVEKALDEFVKSRVLEGEKLKEDLLLKLDTMEELVGYIEERSPEIITRYRARLEEKVRELIENTTVEESRIAAEVVMFADKICVDEETVRLKSHITGARAEIMSGGGIGRKLDFVAQEMNREANTILSKANDQEISNRAISLKTEVEKLREQIQNIE